MASALSGPPAPRPRCAASSSAPCCRRGHGALRWAMRSAPLEGACARPVSLAPTHAVAAQLQMAVIRSLLGRRPLPRPPYVADPAARYGRGLSGLQGHHHRRPAGGRSQGHPRRTRRAALRLNRDRLTVAAQVRQRMDKCWEPLPTDLVCTPVTLGRCVARDAVARAVPCSRACARRLQRAGRDHHTRSQPRRAHAAPHPLPARWWLHDGQARQPAMPLRNAAARFGC
jgi:hypothetical protein